MMNEDKKYTKLVLHVSEELHSRLQDASSRNKLSIGSLIREALEQYLDKGKK